MEGPLEEDDKLRGEGMNRFATKIDGFSMKYLRFSDDVDDEFRGVQVKDPRDREGHFRTCDFHIYKVREKCYDGTVLD